MSVVLMYHGIFPDDDHSSIDAEDLPYAVSVSDFTRQLDLLAGRNVGLYSAGDMPEVVLTFDDGHASNLHLAAPLLQERQLSAYFFITSDFIGQRPGFMTPKELSALSELPGMCIGGHGMTHKFFDDMSTEESLHELSASRTRLESICGSRCHSLSFPGGRFSAETLAQLSTAGYTQWFGSEIGLVSAERLPTSAQQAQESSASQADNSDQTQCEDRWKLTAQRDRQPLERVAIRRNTQLAEFRRIIDQDLTYFRKKRRNSHVKQLVRRAIGNRLYHGLYKSLTAR